MARLVPREQAASLFGTHGPHHSGPPNLGFKDTHEDVADLVDHQTVPRLPRLRPYARNGVFRRQRVRAVNKRIDPSGVSVKHHARVVVHDFVVGLGAGHETKAPHELVLLQCAVSDSLGPPAAAAQAVVLHLPQPVLGGDEALGEKRIVYVSSPDVGDAKFVPVYLDLVFQPVELQCRPTVWGAPLSSRRRLFRSRLPFRLPLPHFCG